MGLPYGGRGQDDDSNAQDAMNNRPTESRKVPKPVTDKLKASNFPVSILKIGNWERTSPSIHEEDLVGKFYYMKRKFAWEVRESGLTSKIEIQWSDISAMKVTCSENFPTTLEIEVSRPPMFFREMRETNGQPRRGSLLWQAASDFTDGQASSCKTHSLQVPEGVLSRHYKKVLERDPRLKALVEGAFSMEPMQDFDQQPNWMFDANHEQHLPVPHQPILGGHHNGALDGNTSGLPVFHHPHHLLSPPGGDLVNHAGEVLSDPKAEVRPIKMQPNDWSSLSSVVDPQATTIAVPATHRP